MKHLILLSLFTFHSSLFTLSASAGIPLKWTVETSRATPAQFEAYQGETLDFEAALQSYGKPLESPSNYSLYWQTNGMGSTYWSVPCTVPSASSPTGAGTNVIFATWSPTNDVGAKVYNCFIGQPGTIYHAAFQLRLRPSPGALPNELPLPTPVIDFAKVTVLNPPWSGGGGGVDTNTVLDIIHKTVDGSARPLPKYLWTYNADDSYPDAAVEYYRSRGNGKVDGGCSTVRDGGFLYRNFDYPFDDRAEFVVKMSAGPNRFASVGVAQVGTNLTEKIVTSGKPNRCYKWLPGATVDGINEKGVCAEINVVDGDPQTSGWHTTGDLHPLGAVRWILDHATNAQHAATYLAANIRFPQGWRQNFHYMIADAENTYIVENGSVGDTQDFSDPAITNYKCVDKNGQYDPHVYEGGQGTERLSFLREQYDFLFAITNAWYTRAYRRETTPPWVSDLAEVIAYTNEIFDAWAAHPKEYFRNKTNGGEPWWQSVHTSIYDITNRTLRVAVQEVDDWYTFAVDQANVYLAPIEAQIETLQSGKRDLTERKVYDEYSPWVATPALPDGYSILWHESYRGWIPAYFDQETGDPIVGGMPQGDKSSTELTWVGGVNWSQDYDMTIRRTKTPTPTGDNFVTESQMSDALSAKVDKSELAPNFQGGKLYAAGDRVMRGGTLYRCKTAITEPAGWQPSSWEEIEVIGKLRDEDDNTCHKIGFTEWTFSGSDYDPSKTYTLKYDGTAAFGWTLIDGSSSYRTVGDENETRLSDFEIGGGGGTVDITATRTAVCTTGELYTTQGYVDAKVSAAVLTNDIVRVATNAAIQATEGIYRPFGDDYIYVPAGYGDFEWSGDRQDALDAIGTQQPYIDYEYGNYVEYAMSFEMHGNWYWGSSYNTMDTPVWDFWFYSDYYDEDTGEWVYDSFQLTAKRKALGWRRKDPVDTFAAQSDLTQAVRSFNAISNTLYSGETKEMRTGESWQYGSGWGYYRRPLGSDFRSWRIRTPKTTMSGPATSGSTTISSIQLFSGVTTNLTATSNPLALRTGQWMTGQKLVETRGSYGSDSVEQADYVYGAIPIVAGSNDAFYVNFMIRNTSRVPMVYEVSPVLDGWIETHEWIGGTSRRMFYRDVDIDWLDRSHYYSASYSYYHNFTKPKRVYVDPTPFTATNTVPLTFYLVSDDKDGYSSNPSYSGSVYDIKDDVRTYTMNLTFNTSQYDDYVLPAGRVVTERCANLIYDEVQQATYRIAVSNGCSFIEYVSGKDWRKEEL